MIESLRATGGTSTTHGDLLPDPLSTFVGDPVRFNRALGTVIDYSLAKRTDRELQLHRLVQAALRARHTRPGQQ